MEVSGILNEAANKFKPTTVEKLIPIELDLGYLYACDSQPIDSASLLNQKEDFLKNLARDNSQLLLNAIFSLPTTRVDDGVVADLPPPKTPLPREKPIPKPKPLTRWEKFAKVKGIQKKKRSKMVFDETYQEYKPRYGYKRANDEINDWLIEVPSNADPMENQFEKKTKEKKERVEKNKQNQKKNVERALNIRKVNGGGKIMKEQKKKELESAIRVTKTSTASLGKFDAKLKDEPKVKNSYQRRHYDPVTIGGEVEKQKSLELL